MGIIQHILQGEKPPLTSALPAASTAALPSLVSTQSTSAGPTAALQPGSNGSQGIFQTKVFVDIPLVPGYDLAKRIKGPGESQLVQVCIPMCSHVPKSSMLVLRPEVSSAHNKPNRSHCCSSISWSRSLHEVSILNF